MVERLKLRRAFSKEKADIKKFKTGVSASVQQMETFMKNMEDVFAYNITTLVDDITEETNQLFQKSNDMCITRYLLISHP